MRAESASAIRKAAMLETDWLLVDMQLRLTTAQRHQIYDRVEAAMRLVITNETEAIRAELAA